jgi:hypothetical protein
MVVLTIDSLGLVEGTYKLDVAVHRKNGVPYDYPPVALYLPGDIALQGRRHFFGRHITGRSLAASACRDCEMRSGPGHSIDARSAVCAAEFRREAERWCSPTASSIFCIPVTSGICRKPAGLARR